MSQLILRLRPMQPDDLPAVMAIEERVFIGDAWSESTYRRDLANPNALYCILQLAAEDNDRPSPPASASSSLPAPLHSSTSRSNVLDLHPAASYSPFATYHLSLATSHQPPAACHLLGYAGCWFIADEAHLMTIAIAPEWQGRGLGEWLLLKVLDLVEARGAIVCTLEVRVSNAPAQALYRKLGFTVAGRRRRYYQDNGEDALIMTTPPLHAPAMLDLRERRRQAVNERLVQLTLL